MPMKGVLAAAAAFGIAASAHAAKPTDDVAIGAAFLDTCVRHAPDEAAIRAGIAADSQWSKTEVPPKFGLTPKAASAHVDAWSRTIDGHEVLLVLIDDEQSKGLKHNCAFVIRDERPAMWYFRSVSDHLKDYGMKLNRQNIPHWRFHQGKFANGQRGEVELRSRSAALPGKDVLHLAIAY
jgi:hypothetical protein